MENQEKLEEMKDVKVEKKDEKLDAEKVQEIVKKAKAKGKITYEELAKELENTNPDQIDKVFDAFEEMGVNILNDDFEDEPDLSLIPHLRAHETDSYLVCRLLLEKKKKKKKRKKKKKKTKIK